MKKLTQKQTEIYHEILDYMYQFKIPPTVDDLSRKFGYKSNNAVSCHLDALKRKGYIRSTNYDSQLSRNIVIMDNSFCPYCTDRENLDYSLYCGDRMIK